MTIGVEVASTPDATSKFTAAQRNSLRQDINSFVSLAIRAKAGNRSPSDIFKSFSGAS
jgi:hypothetical protein